MHSTCILVYEAGTPRPEGKNRGPRPGVGATSQGPVKVDWVERDPSPTALRSPLSPWRGIKIKIPALSVGERGDRKAVGEGSFRG